MSENLIAKILFVIGVAQMAAGLIIGLITVTADYYMVSWSVLFAWTAGGFVSGMLFIGFAENIRLLHSINEKTRPLERRPKQEQKVEEPQIETPQTGWVLSEDEKAKIHEAYQGEAIVEIVPSPEEDYFLVRFKSGDDYYVKVVHVGGFSVQETANADIRQSIIQWYNEKD
ncbi:hypothetical protein [Lentibacillus salicampi]|uniref:Uncharacterized protein n=1 Tax=Lentibacillus salicampi TaxID=175306 RepID=A0A4Y9AA20_9BACI|nr:hypothetical protein [Lentibacillus salicampi]TFJ92738.1 hypothetical protein E4U82_10660 [Lentibacillus salicampi]